MAGEIIIPPYVEATTLDIKDLTEVKIEGLGVLDQLLHTMRLHLGEQYDKSRIRGPEYATVYLGAFQSTLDSAISFLLSKQKQGLELKLLEAQTDQIREEMKKIPEEIKQIQAQTQLVIKQTALADKQIEQADKQLELLDAQVQVQLKQLDLLKEQVEQAKQQSEYYKQRTITEKAQTDGSVIKTGSVIGTQVSLMGAQKDGYQRNAEQQATQILANTWNVRRQTDESTSANTTNHLDDASVGKAVQKLLSGINVTV